MNSRRHFLFKLAAAAPVALGGLILAQDTPPPGETRGDRPRRRRARLQDRHHQGRCREISTAQGRSEVFRLRAGDSGLQGRRVHPLHRIRGKLVTANGGCIAFVKKPDPGSPIRSDPTFNNLRAPRRPEVFGRHFPLSRSPQAGLASRRHEQLRPENEDGSDLAPGQEARLDQGPACRTIRRSGPPSR